MVGRLMVSDHQPGERAHGVEVGPRGEHPRQLRCEDILEEDQVAVPGQEPVRALFQEDLHDAAPAVARSDSRSAE